MPTYEYVCTECGEPLEVVQGFHDDPLTVCPACNGKLRKLFSSVGVVFKGSGFYKTDSRSAKPKSATAASAGSSETTKPSSISESAGADSSSGAKASDSASGSSSGASTSDGGSSSSSSDSTGGGSKVA